jgi:hypothetical protein
MHLAVGKKQERKPGKSGSSSAGILGHPEEKLVVPLQAADCSPFLARCFRPEAYGRECVKFVRSCVCVPIMQMLRFLYA